MLCAKVEVRKGSQDSYATLIGHNGRFHDAKDTLKASEHVGLQFSDSVALVLHQAKPGTRLIFTLMVEEEVFPK